MSKEPELLKEALHELIRLKVGASDSTRLLSTLYHSALDEWSVRLGVEARKLNLLVLGTEVISPSLQG